MPLQDEWESLELARRARADKEAARAAASQAYDWRAAQLSELDHLRRERNQWRAVAVAAFLLLLAITATYQLILWGKL
jgi:hypothetical protein